MAFQRQASHLVIGDDLLRQRHRRQPGIRLLAQLRRLGRGEQWQHPLRSPARFPQCLAPAEPDRAAGIGIAKQPQRARRQPGALRQLLDMGEARVPRRDQLRRPFLAEAVDLAEAQADRERAIVPPLEQIVMVAGVDIRAAHLHSMLARVADQLGGRIKAHRLRIEQRAGEHRRMMAFEPGRNIDQLGEALGMAFGKPIASEALDLVVAALRESAIVAAPHHPLDHLRFIAMDRSDIAEGGHGPAKAIGLVRREARRDNGNLHRLFLEQRHAESAAEHVLNSSAGYSGPGDGRSAFSSPLRRRR